MGEQVSPATIAGVNVSAVDDRGVEFIVTLVPTQGRQENATFRVDYDGSRSGAVGVIDALGFRNLSVRQGEGGNAQLSFDYTDRPGRARPREEPPPVQGGGEIATTGPSSGSLDADSGIINAARYQDPALCPYPDNVDMGGRRRPISLDNAWDIGGNVYANEAGSSVWAAIRYTYRGSSARPFDAILNGGNMWFGEQAAPFARLLLRPGISVWRLRLNYYGSVAAVGNMPSVLYTSHSVGLGYSQPIGDNFRLRLGGIIGGALSYPAWDDIYFNMAFGASAEFHNFLVYVMPNFYFAANDPIKTAFVGNYRPQFQDVEFGVQYRFYEDQYTARLFGDWGVLNQRVGARITRTINFSDNVSGDIWIGGGATHWDDALGGRWDPMAFMGLNLVFGGRYINSTNTFRYEHMQSGGVRFAETSFPTQADPGPYGFGRSGNAEVDAQVNAAKTRIMESRSFAEFSSTYGSASTNEKIMAARFLGAFLQQVAYANNAWEALNNTRFFDPEVQRISGATTDTMYSYIQRYVGWYNSHSPNDPLPDELRNGIAICAGIHQLMAEFLRGNGIPTIVASVNTRNGPHVVAIAQPPEGVSLLDYGNEYKTPPGTFDQAIRFYGQNRQAPTFQSQLFGPNGYMGTYETSEGRLLHESIGIINTRVLGTDFLGVR
jgi:hypothetical protein